MIGVVRLGLLGAGAPPPQRPRQGGTPWTPVGALILFVFALLSACAPAIDFGRATTLDVGEVRYAAGAEGSLLLGDLRPDQTMPLPWANVTAGVKAGVADGIEVGGRGWAFGWPGLFTTFGLAADGKVQVHRSRFRGDPNVATGLSLAWHSPALGNQPWTVLNATVPVLVGFDVGRGQIVLSPRAAGYFATSYGQRPIWTGAVGGGLAWFLPIGDAEIVPEIVWMWSPINWDGTLHQPDRFGARGVHAGFTIGWGTGVRGR